ncbi:MAG: putative oxidoreductase C-terminal domain-containing protein [Balneolaceae bacterium]
MDVYNTLFRLTLLISLIMTISCEPDRSAAGFSGSEHEVKIMTLNPGHFHAGLVHKYGYDQVDPRVHIYAPDGPELESHLALLNQFNSREENPTSWETVVYRGNDYLNQMLEEKPGNVMVVAGNNARKIDYIHAAVNAGIHVLADKPMIIHHDRFDLLQETLELADEEGLLVNDIMTERHEITSILQKELSGIPELFGELESGSPEDPAITKESVHFFNKVVAGEPLIRPSWFFDVTQQGEAIVDVSTHLVDLILWQSYPEEPIDYRNPGEGITVHSARVWDTPMTGDEFERVTGQLAWPDFLQPYVDSEGLLQVAANGEFIFKVRDTWGKVAVLWGYENPGGGDTHYSIMRGTDANLIIRQDEEQGYQATLYAEPVEGRSRESFEEALTAALGSLSDRYPGLTAEYIEGLGWEIGIPVDYKEGHEEHFTRVTELYLDYLVEGELPDWERVNLLTKYYITTRAYEMSR